MRSCLQHPSSRDPVPFRLNSAKLAVIHWLAADLQAIYGIGWSLDHRSQLYRTVLEKC